MQMCLYQSLNHYVPSRMADALRKESENSLATRKADVTVTFGDIRGIPYAIELIQLLEILDAGVV